MPTKEKKMESLKCSMIQKKAEKEGKENKDETNRKQIARLDFNLIHNNHIKC